MTIGADMLQRAATLPPAGTWDECYIVHPANVPLFKKHFPGKRIVVAEKLPVSGEAEALADFHAPLVDSIDAKIAAGRGLPAPWPTRTLLRRIERMSEAKRAEFLRAVDKLAEGCAP